MNRASRFFLFVFWTEEEKKLDKFACVCFSYSVKGKKHLCTHKYMVVFAWWCEKDKVVIQSKLAVEKYRFFMRFIYFFLLEVRVYSARGSSFLHFVFIIMDIGFYCSLWLYDLFRQHIFFLSFASINGEKLIRLCIVVRAGVSMDRRLIYTYKFFIAWRTWLTILYQGKYCK
jgi:hypothetical protein